MSFFPALYGHQDVLVALLKAQADPSAAAVGLPLLFAAATMGHTQVMKELLDRNASPNVRSKGEFWGFRETMPVLHAAVLSHQVIRAGGEIEVAPSNRTAA